MKSISPDFFSITMDSLISTHMSNLEMEKLKNIINGTVHNILAYYDESYVNDFMLCILKDNLLYNQF